MLNASGLLGLAARSRLITTGETIYKQFRSNKIKLIILSAEIGDNSKKKLTDKCSFYHVPYVFMDDDEMNQAIGSRNKKSVAILDEGFAEKLHTCLKG